MSAITITPTTVFPTFNLPDGGSITLRGFYSQRFQDSDGILVVMPGNGIQGFYYEWDCTLDGDGNIVIPEMVIRTTNGVDVSTSLFTGQLFVDENPGQIVFGFPTGPGWIIPASFGSSTAWDQLDIFNQGQVQLTNISAQTTLSANAIIALIQSIPRGYSGFSGVSGYSGFSGISGYSGFTGVSGYSGYSGKSGFSGFSGV